MDHDEAVNSNLTVKASSALSVLETFGVTEPTEKVMVNGTCRLVGYSVVIYEDPNRVKLVGSVYSIYHRN